MKNQDYTQCLLTNGTATEVAWIPRSLAKIGKWIEVKKTKTEWFVLDTYSTMKKDAVERNANDYRTQRDASDI